MAIIAVKPLYRQGINTLEQEIELDTNLFCAGIVVRTLFINIKLQGLAKNYE